MTRIPDENNGIWLDILGVTKEYGCVVYTAIFVCEDYTMNEVVSEVRRRGFKAFCLLGTMKRLVNV